jgi:hypothetical protein
MACTACGAEATASCNCGVSYVPKAQRAAEVAAANPNASVREIAEKAGVGHGTAQRAKAAVPNGTPEPVTGRDAKKYKAKKKPAAKAKAAPQIVADGTPRQEPERAAVIDVLAEAVKLRTRIIEDLMPLMTLMEREQFRDVTVKEIIEAAAPSDLERPDEAARKAVH